MSELSGHIFPLRIGVNTAGVYFGDLGDEWRIDFTIIGHGVNFAQRLEASCEAFRIMISPATWATVTTRSTKDPQVNQRIVQIKHHKDAYAAYELNPFVGQEKRLDDALRKYNDAISVQRFEERRSTPKRLKIIFKSEFGDGTIVDYSNSGIAIHMSNYLAKGFMVTLTIELPQQSGEVAVIRHVLTGEVRWGKPRLDGFYHGIQFRKDDQNKFKLINDLRALCESVT